MGNRASTSNSGSGQASAIPVAVPVVDAQSASSSPLIPTIDEGGTGQSASSSSSIPTINEGATGITVTTSTELSVYPDSSSTDTLVGINLTGCAAPSDTDRAPVDVVVVADVSGSMGGEKMTLLKGTMKLLLGDVVGKDRVGLVTFDSNVKEAVRLQPLTSEAKASAEQVIDKLRAGSCTNLSGGLFQGIQQLVEDSLQEKNSNTSSPSRCRTVLLMTDGQANVGLQTSGQIVPIVQNMLKDANTTLHTFGYGADHDSGLLRDLATAGNGSYYYVEGVDDIRGAFGDCLGGLLSVVAQNLELTVEAASSGASITKVHHKNAVAAGPGRWKIRYPDLYGEEQRDLLVGLTIQKTREEEAASAPGTTTAVSPAALTTIDALRYSLSYVDVLAGAPAVVRNTVAVQLSSGATCAEKQTRDAKLELQATRLEVAETLDTARAAAEKGDLDAARSLVTSTRGKVAAVQERCASVEGADTMLPTFLEDLDECSDGLTNQATFFSKKHKMTMMAEGHTQQRCMESSSVKSIEGGGSSLRKNAYRTKAKAAKASAWLS